VPLLIVDLTASASEKENIFRLNVRFRAAFSALLGKGQLLRGEDGSVVALEMTG
jgi:hypothetical protein